jgi:hypothetical protein
MKRRDSLKALTLSSLGLAGLNPQVTVAENVPDTPVKVPGGRQKFEAERDEKLKKEKFFTEHELKTVTVLGDIIIPKDEHSGSASEAGVPAFIEFMMKDVPHNQTPMRGGIRWLDNQCKKRYNNPFVKCTKAQQIEMVDMIAYPEQATPEMSQGVAFFNTMRGFVATGFYTSQIGIKDIGYMGNTPNQWQGVPEEVLKQYGLSYDG